MNKLWFVFIVLLFAACGSGGGGGGGSSSAGDSDLMEDSSAMADPDSEGNSDSTVTTTTSFSSTTTSSVTTTTLPPSSGSVVLTSVAATTVLTTETAQYRIVFQPGTGLTENSTVSFTFPSGFDVSNASIDSVPGYTIQSISGQTITILANSLGVVDAGGFGTAIFTNIVNPPLPGTYSIQVTTSLDTTPGTGSIEITSSGGSVTLTSISATSVLTTQTAEYRIIFSPETGLLENDTVTITFPNGFNISGASLDSLPGYTIQSISGQTITFLTTSFGVVDAAGFGTIIIQNIVNPSLVGTYSLQVATSTDTSAGSNSIDIAAGGSSVSLTSVAASIILTSQTAQYRILFSPETGLTENSTVTLTFPSGFDISNASVGTLQSYTIQSISGQTITLVATSFGVVSAGSFGTIILQNIVNPSVAGTYSLSVSTSIDTTAGSNSINITSSTGSTSVTSVSATIILTSQTAQYRILFSPETGLIENSTVTVTFASGFDISGATATSTPGFSIQSISGQAVTFLAGSLGVVDAGGFGTLILDNIVNPASPGTYSIEVSTSIDTTSGSGSITISSN